MEQINAFCQASRPLTMVERLSRRLFPGTTRPYVSAAEKRTYVTVETHFHLDWKDRLRILVTGHGVAIAHIYTDVEVKAAESVVNFGVAR